MMRLREFAANAGTHWGCAEKTVSTRQVKHEKCARLSAKLLGASLTNAVAGCPCRVVSLARRWEPLLAACRAARCAQGAR